MASESESFSIRVQTRNERHYMSGVSEYKVKNPAEECNFCMKAS